MKILTLYFSATGNTKYIAELFSSKMDAKCRTIEADVDFSCEIKEHDVITFCYPIYGSRVPRIMREFAFRYKAELDGKKIVIFVTQVMFSGDGARVFTDLLKDIDVEVIYAEHFLMPNNVGNIFIFRKQSPEKLEKYVTNANKKMENVCRDIKDGIIRRRGFSSASKLLGCIQGKLWQGDSRKVEPSKFSAEVWSKNRVKIRKECNSCGLCVKICPVGNFSSEQGEVKPNGNCIVCYRCINKCPQRAISIMIGLKPRWQYEGIE